jgi:hypothetical protein
MATPLQELEGAEESYERVRAEMEALNVAELSALNVDVVSASSIAQGVAERALSFRERMAKLPEFDLKNVDSLLDYARAAWFVYVTNLPIQETASTSELSDECAKLRGKLLMWAAPLVGAGIFEQAALDRVKEGAGAKDVPSDVVALVGLYRSRWEDVKGICAVTDEDLQRGSLIGPELFARLSRRDFPNPGISSDGTLRVRRAWTLLDRAYAQCRRAVAFLRSDEGDVDTLLPSLRRNMGPAAPKASAPTPPAPVGQPSPVEGSSTTGAGSSPPPASGARSLDAGPLINGGAPFAAKS